jgi:hypothetical protein
MAFSQIARPRRIEDSPIMRALIEQQEAERLKRFIPHLPASAQDSSVAAPVALRLLRGLPSNMDEMGGIHEQPVEPIKREIGDYRYNSAPPVVDPSSRISRVLSQAPTQDAPPLVASVDTEPEQISPFARRLSLAPSIFGMDTSGIVPRQPSNAPSLSALSNDAVQGIKRELGTAPTFTSPPESRVASPQDLIDAGTGEGVRANRISLRPNVETGERPVRPDTGDVLADEIEYRRQLEAYKPKSHNSRWAGLGLGLLRGLARGGLGGAIVGGLRGVIDKSADEKDARLEAIPQSDANIERQFGQRKAISDLGNQQSVMARRNAEIPYLLSRPELERDKFEQKRSYDAWRMKSGDRKADTYENYIQWKMENGDRTTTTREDYQKWQRDIGERRFGEVQRHNQVNEDIGRAGIGVRQDSNEISRERIGAAGAPTAASTAREQANAQRLLNTARTLRTRAAAAKTQEAADALTQQAEDVENDLVTQYPDYVEEEEQAATGIGRQIGMPAKVKTGRLKLKTRATQGTTPTRGAAPKSAWQEYVDKYFKGDEAKARAYQNK